MGVSLLSNVGLAELIAQSPEEYVSIAVELTGDLSRLAEMRRTMRPRMQASGLMDASRFAGNVEAAYRQMWRNWCAEHGTDQTTLQQQIESAVSNHQAGRLTEAEGIYRQILAIDPDNVDVLHLARDAGQPDGPARCGLGADWTGHPLKPDLAVAHNNLGKIMRDMGRIHDAIAAFQRPFGLSLTMLRRIATLAPPWKTTGNMTRP